MSTTMSSCLIRYRSLGKSAWHVALATLLKFTAKLAARGWAATRVVGQDFACCFAVGTRNEVLVCVRGTSRRQVPYRLRNTQNELNHEDAKRFQSGAATLMYRALDHSRLQFETGMVVSGTAKPLCRRHGTSDASCAVSEGCASLRVGVQVAGEASMFVLSDDDRASDEETRCSTSCCHLYVGGRLAECESC